MNKGNIFIRVDGGNEEGLGMGHVFRCLNFALFLKKKEFNVVFILKKYPKAGGFIRKQGFALISLRKDIKEANELKRILLLMRSLRPKLFIADIREISNEYIETISKEKCYFVYFDDLGRTDLKPDMLINPSPCKSFQRYSNSTSTAYLLGLKYHILNNRRIFKKRQFRVRRIAKNIVFSFGGSDPKDCSYKIIKLIKYLPADINYTFILGPTYRKKDRLFKYLKNPAIKMHKVITKENINNLINIFKSSDIAVISGGDTLVEALFSGIPSIVIPTIWYEDAIAKEFVKKGLVIKTNRVEDLQKHDFIDKVKNLANNYNFRLAMHRKGKGIVDAKGVNRIYQRLNQYMDS